MAESDSLEIDREQLRLRRRNCDYPTEGHNPS